MADGYISSMISAPTVGQNDLMEVSIVDGTSSTGYSTRKTNISQLGGAVVKDVEYITDLHTESKTIIGAVNELADAVNGTVVSAGSAYSTITFQEVKKINGIVHFSITFTMGASGAANWVKLFTFPTGFRPSNSPTFFAYSQNTTTHGAMQITSAGEARFANSTGLSANNSYHINGSFVAA